MANWIILALLVRLSDAARRPVTAAPRIIDTAELPTSIRKNVLNADTPDDASVPPDQGSAAPVSPPEQHAAPVAPVPPQDQGPAAPTPSNWSSVPPNQPVAPVSPPDQHTAPEIGRTHV